MRLGWVAGAVVLFVVSCAAPVEEPPGPKTWAETAALPDAVRLPFPVAEACDEKSCFDGEALPQRVKDVVLTREGDTVRVALTLSAWVLVPQCGLLGCSGAIWEPQDSTRCFEVSGATVTPTTGCVPAARPAASPGWSPSSTNPLSVERSTLRAFFTRESDEADIAAGDGVAVGDGWLGDVVTQARSERWWGLETAGEVHLSAFVKAGRLEWWLPSLGNRPFSAGVVAPPGDAVYWADPVDRLYELRATADAFLVRPVREARLPPKTTTRGVLEDGDDVFTVVESASGLPARSPSLARVSLVRSRKLDAPVQPLLPFGLVAAHAPTADQLIACFTEPLDPASLSAAQFVGGDGLEVKATLPSPAPQCAALATSLMRANRASTVRVTGLKSRGGRALPETVFSITGDPLATGRDVVAVAPLSSSGPLGAALEVGLPEGDLFASSLTAWGRRDVSATLVQLLGELTPAPTPTQGGLVADPQARAVFALVREGGNTGPLRLERRSPSGLEVLEDTQGTWSSLYLWALGDGSALIIQNPGTFARARFPEGLTPLGTNPPIAVDPWAGEYFVSEGGRARVGRLDDGALTSESWALPTRVAAFGAKAVKSGTRRWLCSLEGLVLLGDTASPAQDRCEHVSVDPDGRAWVTLGDAGNGPSRLARLDGDQLVPVPLPHPFDPTETVLTPEFVGDRVFTNQLSVRFSLAEWRALVGGTP